MTYPDDVLKAAREAAANVWERKGRKSASDLAQGILDGIVDDFDEVQSACIAIMAERERVKNGC